MNAIRWVLLVPACLLGGYAMTVLYRAGLMLVAPLWFLQNAMPWLNAIAEGLGMLIGVVLAAQYTAPHHKETAVRVTCGLLATYAGMVAMMSLLDGDAVKAASLAIISVGGLVRSLTTAFAVPV